MVSLALARWLNATKLSWFVNHYPWVWPACESIHFIGMAFLIGTVGLFDLRLLGIARRLPAAALHPLVRFGIAGFAMNLATGMFFIAGTPSEFIFNRAFQLKVLFILLAGVNVLVFYLTAFRDLEALEPGRDTPLRLKLIGGTSLSLWLAVMVCGRLLTFFRPIGPLHPLF